MLCKYTCAFWKGTWLKMGVCGGRDCNTEQARKKEKWKRKDRSSKGEDWRLGLVLRHRENQHFKQARGTIAAGGVVGMVR